MGEARRDPHAGLEAGSRERCRSARGLSARRAGQDRPARDAGVAVPADVGVGVAPGALERDRGQPRALAVPLRPVGAVGDVARAELGVEDQRAVGRELRDVGLRAPADEDVAVGEHLDVALAGGEELLRVRVGAAQRDAPARSRRRSAAARATRARRCRRGVIEPSGWRRASCCQANTGLGVDREVRVLAPETPDDLAARAVDLVDRVGVARGHEQVPVRVDADRVQVDVVPVGAQTASRTR